MNNLVVMPFIAPNWTYKWAENNKDSRISSKIIEDIGGTHNGYILISKDHPWFGISADDMNDKVKIHGGWTFAENAKCVAWEEVPEEYRTSDYYIYGFDTIHAGDNKAYWSEEKTYEEVAKASEVFLTEQLKHMRNENKEVNT